MNQYKGSVRNDHLLLPLTFGQSSFDVIIIITSMIVISRIVYLLLQVTKTTSKVILNCVDIAIKSAKFTSGDVGRYLDAPLTA